MDTREPNTDIPDDGGWDARVTAWERVCATKAFQTLAAEVMHAAKPSPDDRAVDLGAGTGLLALELAARVERVVAVDASQAMLGRLEERSAREGIDNLEVSHADLRSLPLDDESATLIVSNYAFHHLDDEGKELALAEARRVLQPGGRLIVCDMMFDLSLSRRDRKVIGTKLWTIARRGPAGFVRIGRNAARVVTGTWEKPAPPEVWQAMLARRKFTDVSIRLFEHEGGLAIATRPRITRTATPRQRPAGERGTAGSSPNRFPQARHLA